MCYKHEYTYHATIKLNFCSSYIFNHGTESKQGGRTKLHRKECEAQGLYYDVFEEKPDRVREKKKIIDPKKDYEFINRVVDYININFLNESEQKALCLKNWLDLNKDNKLINIAVIQAAKLSETECCVIPDSISLKKLKEVITIIETTWYYKNKDIRIDAKLDIPYKLKSNTEKKMAAKPIAHVFHRYFLKESNLDKNTNYNIISVQSIELAYMIYSFGYKYNKLKIIITADDKEKNEIPYNIMLRKSNIEMVECETDLEVEEEYTDMEKQKSFYNGKNKILMNPPFDDSLHLQITESVLKIRKINPDTEVVSISPVRWLEDILALADYRGACDYRTYKTTIVDNISNLQIVSIIDASNNFEIGAPSDLGIYTFNSNKNVPKVFSDMMYSIIRKVLNKQKPVLNSKCEKEKLDGYRVEIKKEIQEGNHNSGNAISSKTAPVKICLGPYLNGYDSKNIFWSLGRTKNQHTRAEGSPFPISIPFATEEAANNFVKSCQTNWYKNLIHLTKSNITIQLNYLPYMEDYETHAWSDEDYCKYFELTSEESEFMCRTVDDYRIKDFINYINLDED